MKFIFLYIILLININIFHSRIKRKHNKHFRKLLLLKKKLKKEKKSQLLKNKNLNKNKKKLRKLFTSIDNPEIIGTDKKSSTGDIKTTYPIGDIDPDNPLNPYILKDTQNDFMDKRYNFKIQQNELYLSKLMRLIRLAQQFRNNAYFNVKLKIQFRSHAFYDSTEAEEENKNEKKFIN